MSNIIVQQFEGELRVSSENVAERTGVEHRAILQLISSHNDDYEAFGDLAFEMRDRPGVPGPALRVALLNEQQATLLITYMRNTDQVRYFKRELVKQFYAMRQALTPIIPTSFAEALELAAAQARKLEVAQPKAEAWDQLASAEGDYEVADAAKILARADVMTGQRRLFTQLQALGWIFRGSHGSWVAYQNVVDRGWLAEKPQFHYHPQTGEKVIDPAQVRVTVKGIDRLRVVLTNEMKQVA